MPVESPPFFIKTPIMFGVHNSKVFSPLISNPNFWPLNYYNCFFFPLSISIDCAGAHTQKHICIMFKNLSKNNVKLESLETLIMELMRGVYLIFSCLMDHIQNKWGSNYFSFLDNFIEVHHCQLRWTIHSIWTPQWT